MKCDICSSNNNTENYNLALILEPAKLYVVKDVISLCPECYEKLCLAKLVNKVENVQGDING